MKKFLLKFLCCVIMLVAIDYVVAITHNNIFSNLPDKTTQVSSIYYSLFKKEADILILGSSTANHHYNAQMMEDSLGMTVYNSGLDGFDMIYFDVVLQSSLERRIPKCVLLDIGQSHLDGSWISRISDAKLYYGKNDAITHYYDTETDWQQQLKLKSGLYRYNKTISTLVRLKILNNYNTMKGYAPLVGKRDEVNWSESSEFSVDSTELKHLNNIVTICKEHEIQLVLIQSPQANNNADFNVWVKEFANAHELSLVQENKNSYYREHPELFYDDSHLNADGADVFTQRIMTLIKTILFSPS